MSYKILVVEDDNQIQELIVEFLSSQGYKVDMANDGVEGYEKFKKECNSNVDNTYHIQSNELLNEKNILLNLENESKEEAIIRAGNLLFNNGYVGYEYINSMLEREKRISTYILLAY